MITIRQSALSSIIKWCPLSASYQYGLGVEPLEGPTAVELFLGNCTHLALASAYQADAAGDDKWSVNDIVDRFIGAWQEREVAPGERPIMDIDWKDEPEGRYQTDGVAMVQAYYPMYLKTKAKLVEYPLEKVYAWEELRGDAKVTTRLDLVTTFNSIVDIKTSAVNKRRNGTEYFYAYGDYTVPWLPQPFIHLAVHGKARPYSYHVLGKGDTALVEEIRVVHSQQQVDTWEKNVLLPTLQQVAAGSFPARPGSQCNWCPLAHRKECGMLGVTA